MTTRAAELAKLLQPMKGLSVSSSPDYSTSSYGTPSFSWSGVFTVLLVFFIILLIVHFTVKPIFSFSDDDDGFIPLGYRSDGQLTWTDGPVAADLSGNVTKIIPCGITIQQDIYIENESVVSNQRRIFFYRSTSPLPNIVDDPSKDLIKQFPESNLIMYLLPNTNDLTVSAITQKKDKFYIESAQTILNVPVKQTFRLTVVLYQQAIEVYINGNLSGTKAFRYPVRMTSGYFFGAPNLYRLSVRTMNFKYWDRTLQAREISRSTPALASMTSFNPPSLNGACA
jgi:hypothetical protein